MRYAANETKWPIRECVIAGAGALALVACLPLFGLVIFMLRPFMLTAIVLMAALLTALAILSPWVLVPRQQGRWTADVAPEQAYKGLRLARDVVLHPGHSWAWIDDEVIVGVDDIAQAALGHVDEVKLPVEGAHVHRGDPLFRLRHGERCIDLPSPVSGTVLRCNQALRTSPDLVNSRPFSLGWVARIRGEDPLDDRRHLLRGRKAWGWFRGEVDRVFHDASAPAASPPGFGPDTRRPTDDQSAWHEFQVTLAGPTPTHAWSD